MTTQTKGNPVKGNKRHNWLSIEGYVVGVKSKCTRCNLVRRNYGSKGKIRGFIYSMRGKELEKRPDCTQDQNAQWYQ